MGKAARKKLVRKTRRLEIRPIKIQDYESWKTSHHVQAKPKNLWDRKVPIAKELTKAKFKKIIKTQSDQRRKDVFYDFGVFDKQGALVGNVALMQVFRGISQTAFLGYRIFNPYWGQGYAKEAVRACLDIGFKDLKLHRIEAGIEPRNRRSIKIAKALEMRREGTKKRAILLRDTWVDLLIYTLTTEDVGLVFEKKGIQHKRRI